ncbi:hypothetical protein F5Y19DRAFT_474921 [Xylariaceae sp. FL1651]|nr:hypothetical protein F5Y19DRAFT_474921 [Xylariaceae sp. FL1651]
MSSPVKASAPTAVDRTGDRNGDRLDHRDRDGPLSTLHAPSLPMPGLSGRANSPTGNLLKGPVDDDGKLKNAALMVGIKLDLEAEQDHHHYGRCGPTLHSSHDGFIPGFFFIGGTEAPGEISIRRGNVVVHLQTNIRGFVWGVGHGSVLILQIVVRFKLQFVNSRADDLDKENGDLEKKQERDLNKEKGHMNKKLEPETHGEEREREDSLSLSLTLTITIMSINKATLS